MHFHFFYSLFLFPIQLLHFFCNRGKKTPSNPLLYWVTEGFDFTTHFL